MGYIFALTVIVDIVYKHCQGFTRKEQEGILNKIYLQSG